MKASLATSGTDATWSFSLSTETTVYFKFDGIASNTGLQYPNGQFIFKYPTYVLWNNTSGTPVKRYTFTYEGTPLGGGIADDEYWGNRLNNCLGLSLTLQPGNYSIKKGASGTNPFVDVYRLMPRSQATTQKWWHGGGIRVKSVAYFDSRDIPQNFFDLWPTDRPFPQKQVNYTYNIFGDIYRSSGSTAGNAESGNAPVVYKNVTVTDALAANGRQEYEFYSPIDFAEGSYIYNSDYRVGKLKSKRTYNSQNTLQLESSYQYESISSEENGFDINMGWMVPIKIINKEYFPEGVLQTTDDIVYNANRKVIQKTTSASSLSGPLTTKYYYHTSNSPTSKNRASVEKIEEFLGSNLLSTSIIEYNNSWSVMTNPGPQTNVSYLPSQMKQSKGSYAPELKSKNNMYDQYGHLLEMEQANGVKKSFIWGYNNSQIVAEIENLAYNSIPLSVITSVQNASDINNEPLLLQELNNLRNVVQLPETSVTTYTYKPLVGVLSVTDTRGYKTTYEYDANNRLVVVKDNDGNILTEKEYHTKIQN